MARGEDAIRSYVKRAFVNSWSTRFKHKISDNSLTPFRQGALQLETNPDLLLLAPDYAASTGRLLQMENKLIRKTDWGRHLQKRFTG